MKKPSRLRRIFKWAGRGVLALIVLSALLLVAADLFRQQRMKAATARLNAAIAQVDDEILKGQTPAEWHAARIEGTNGWEHIAVIRDYDDAPTEPELVRIRSALDDLYAFYNGTWQGELPEGAPNNAEYPTTPTPEQIADWMAITVPVAEGFARAAECDVVVVLPKDDEPYPYREGIPVLPIMSACNAMLARCRIHLDDGRDEQAWRELTNYLTTWSKASGPVFLVGYMVEFGAFGLAIEFALEQLESGHMPLEVAREIAGLGFDPVERLEHTIEGEVVWLAASASAAEWAYAEPRWFGWMRGDIPPGEGLFDEDFSSMGDAYLGPAKLSTNIAIALETGLAQVRYLRGEHAWDPTHVPEAEHSPLAIEPSMLFEQRNAVAYGFIDVLRLELRVLEREHGPLVENKNAVERLVAGYRGVVHDWDGDDLLLGVSPEWRRDPAIASEKDPVDDSQIGELVERLSEEDASDEGPSWPVRLAPLTE